MAFRVALLAVMLFGGCGIDVVGDFDGVPFRPIESHFAISDRHDLLETGGTLVPVLRAENDRRIHLFFTAVEVDGNEDWRHFSADRLLTLKKELVSEDGLLLRNLPMAKLLAGETVSLSVAEHEGNFLQKNSGEEMAMVVGTPAAELVAEQGLGADVQIKVSLTLEKEPIAGESASGKIEIKRNRADGQSGEVATGLVTLSFTTHFQPERLGKSNLSLIAPAMNCAARVGAPSAGACRDEAPEKFIDETGPITGN